MTPGSALLLPLYFAAFPAAGRICGFRGREGRGEKAASKWRGALQVIEPLLVTPGGSEEAQEKRQLGDRKGQLGEDKGQLGEDKGHWILGKEGRKEG